MKDRAKCSVTIKVGELSQAAKAYKSRTSKNIGYVSGKPDLIDESESYGEASDDNAGPEQLCGEAGHVVGEVGEAVDGRAVAVVHGMVEQTLADPAPLSSGPGFRVLKECC